MKLFNLIISLVIGIIPQNAPSPLVPELASALHDIGLYKHSTADTLEPQLLAALNSYRRSLSLPEAPYCDPASLRALGIPCSGDELMLLARYAEAFEPRAVERYALCRTLLEEASLLEQGLCETIAARCRLGELLSEQRSVSSETLNAVLLAAVSVD